MTFHKQRARYVAAVPLLARLAPVLLATGVGLSAAPASAPAQAPERPALSARFLSPPVAGGASVLQLSGADAPGVGPVSGFEVDFGPREDAVAGSACALLAGGVPVPPVAGQGYELQLGHVFPASSPQSVRATLRWGGCGAPAAADTKVLNVTPQPGGPGGPLTALFPAIGVIGGLDDALPRRTARAIAAARCRGADRIPRAGNLERSVNTTRCLLNSVRRANGVRSLRYSLRLRRAARMQNLDMRRRRFFAHQSGNGPDLGARLRRARYIPFLFAGENLGGGTGAYITPRNMVRSWMASPVHRLNVLRPRFREMGVSIVPGWPPRGRRSGATYTVEYGQRPGRVHRGRGHRRR